VKNPVKLIFVAAFAVASVICFVLGWIWPGVALAVFMVAAVIWAALTFQRSYLKIKSAELRLKILDGAGNVAHFEKVQELVPLHRPLADIRDRNLFTRGRLDDFDVSPGEIGERMSVGKYYIIKVVFKPPLEPGKAVSRRVAYNIYDAFPGEDVSFMFVGDYPTDDVVFRVEFPPERLPHSSKAYVKSEGRDARPAELALAADRSTLEWHVGRMKPGEQYHLEWSW
jgi:hypothetical protein